MLTDALKGFGRLTIIGIMMMICLQLVFSLLYFTVNTTEILTGVYSSSLFFLRSCCWFLLISATVITLSKKAAQWVFLAFILLMGLIHFMLLSYLTTTGIPLGADLFGYSLSDILSTAGSSSDLKIGGLLALVMSATLAIWLGHRGMTVSTSPKWSFTLIFIPLAYLLPQPKATNYSESQYYKVYSPSAFFWTKSFDYFFDKTTPVRDYGNYPFLHPRDTSNPLADLLSPKKDLPNIVFVAVEGLGADFVGPDAAYGGATPFLDSLITQSLYWPNCLSNTGRTFGVLPTLTGSLPYGQTGFMDYGPDYPTHISLWSWLKANSYSTSYFYGGNPNFDKQDVFLEAQSIDNLFGESSFPEGLNKMPGNTEGFSWGYGDADLFENGLKKLSAIPSPSFSFFMTLTTHEPFVPVDDRFSAAIDELAKSKSPTIYEEYHQVFECLAYTDDALRQFIKSMSKKPQFQNTLFIITGDHRLIPIPAERRLDRFRVPLLIYSPLTKKPLQFNNLVTHSQVTPTLINWLSATYQLPVSDYVSFISTPLMTKPSFDSNLDLALMRSKNETAEYIMGINLLSDGSLYTIREDMSLDKNEDSELKKKLQQKLRNFVSMSHDVLSTNQLLPDSLAIMKRQTTLSPGELATLTGMNLLNTTPDSLYNKARALAIDHQFAISRLICRYGLRNSPNFHDLRVLLGRTYGWNNQYDSAKLVLDEVLRRAENYEDAYIAYSDVAYWNQNSDLALNKAMEGLKRNPNSFELKVRVARSYLERGSLQEATELLDEVIKNQPDHEMAHQLKRRIENL
ncbi:sulfatase-like hydrolase/transferase [Marinoscillum sp.]|uniref:sulfatase-like hydrolase/transferase n=1 Tax=Marinoscillum sp. TaxID=2024838 RepID=UPI003BACE340